MTPATRKRRILQIGKFYPPHMGGIETHLRDLCVSLNDRFDFEVVVAADDRRGSQESVDGIYVRRLPTRIVLASAPLCSGLVNTLRHADTDLVHLHWPHPTGALALLTSGRRTPLVVTYHSDVVRQRLLGRAFRPILRRVLQRATAVITTSKRYAETSQDLATHQARCRVIPHGIDFEPHDRVAPSAVTELRQRFGPRIVLAVGRLTYYKGFEYLIRAMRNVDARLVIVGTGPERGRLENEALRGIRHRIHFAGHVDDVVPYYHAADVFVLPSVARSEAFGIVQLEAMAAGKPIVNTRLDSGVPSVSLDEVTGITVPVADSAALAFAVNRLLADERLRAGFGAAARRRLEEHFTLARMAERTAALYDEVLDERRDPALHHSGIAGSA